MTQVKNCLPLFVKYATVVEYELNIVYLMGNKVWGTRISDKANWVRSICLIVEDI